MSNPVVRSKQGMRSRRGFSLTELLIVIAIILIIVAAAIPRFAKARMFAEETAAVRAVSVIHTAQTQYYSQFGRYATSLVELGPPAGGAEGPNGAGLVDKELGEGKKGGYLFTVQATPQGYVINGLPKQFGTSGSRTFFSDQTQIIRNKYANEPASPQDPEIGAQDKGEASKGAEKK
jgi:type IV pilus assembly protein PilA